MRNRIGLGVIGDAMRYKFGPKPRNRVARHPGLDLILGAVSVAVRFGMAAPAVSQVFHQAWPVARPRTGHGIMHRLGHGREIVAIHRDARHRIGHRPFGNVFHRSGTFGRCGHAIFVVFANKNHRQFPDGSHIQRLVERALIVGPVAEKAHRHIGFAQTFCRQSRPHGNRQTAADNAIGPQIAGLDIGNVHRAATPVAIAGFLAEKFRKHPADIGTFGDAVAMAAMGRGDLVGVGQFHAGGHRTGLLPDRQMHGAMD